MDTESRRALELLADLGASDYVQSLAQYHAARALEALVGIELVPRAWQEFQELVEFLLTRQR